MDRAGTSWAARALLIAPLPFVLACGLIAGLDDLSTCGEKCADASTTSETSSSDAASEQTGTIGVRCRGATCGKTSYCCLQPDASSCNAVTSNGGITPVGCRELDSISIFCDEPFDCVGSILGPLCCADGDQVTCSKSCTGKVVCSEQSDCATGTCTASSSTGLKTCD
jgi:hypothetical protein